MLPSVKVLNKDHHYIDQSDFSLRSYRDSAGLCSLRDQRLGLRQKGA